MLSRRIIPCLDTRAGRVVKGVRFEGIRDVGDPALMAAGYARDGADEVVMLDITATPEARLAARGTVAAIRQVLDIPLTVGGGIRTMDDATSLLDAGADKVSVNSAALDDPSLIDRLATRFGRQCVTVAIDAARREGRWEAFAKGGSMATGRDAVAWASEAQDRGAGEILLTSIDQDGTGEGYEVALITELAARVGVPVVASGGARGVDDMVQALDAGADAVLAASVFHDGRLAVSDVKRALAARGVRVRP